MAKILVIKVHKTALSLMQLSL